MNGDRQLWMGFRRPLRSDWAFWLAVVLAVTSFVSGVVRSEAPWTVGEVVALVVIGVPIYWLISAAAVGIPVGIVRGFRQGLEDGRRARAGRRGGGST